MVNLEFFFKSHSYVPIESLCVGSDKKNTIGVHNGILTPLEKLMPFFMGFRLEEVPALTWPYFRGLVIPFTNTLIIPLQNRGHYLNGSLKL